MRRTRALTRRAWVVASHTAFHGDSCLTIGTNMSEQKMAAGSPPTKRKGMRRPFLCLQRSDHVAMIGSVTASQRRPAEAMSVITLKM